MQMYKHYRYNTLHNNQILKIYFFKQQHSNLKSQIQNYYYKKILKYLHSQPCSTTVWNVLKLRN